MKKVFNLFLITFLSVNLFADESVDQSFPGLVSTEVFSMGNGMEMHIERRKTLSLIHISEPTRPY